MPRHYLNKASSRLAVPRPALRRQREMWVMTRQLNPRSLSSRCDPKGREAASLQRQYAVSPETIFDTVGMHSCHPEQSHLANVQWYTHLLLAHLGGMRGHPRTSDCMHKLQENSS